MQIKVCGVNMENVFKNSKQKELVKIPDFKFIGFHDTQLNVAYYIRKYDNFNNFDFMEAKLEETGNKLSKKYTLGAGTKINILDNIMYSYLKHRKDSDKISDYDSFVELSLKENNMDTKENRERYLNGVVPKEYKETKNYKDILSKGYKLLYVINSSKDKAIEQHYMVFVTENKMELLDRTIEYITFKPVQLLISMEYLKTHKGNKYLVNEFTEVNVPTSILN